MFTFISLTMEICFFIVNFTSVIFGHTEWYEFSTKCIRPTLFLKAIFHKEPISNPVILIFYKTIPENVLFRLIERDVQMKITIELASSLVSEKKDQPHISEN